MVASKENYYFASLRLREKSSSCQNRIKVFKNVNDKLWLVPHSLSSVTRKLISVHFTLRFFSLSQKSDRNHESKKALRTSEKMADEGNVSSNNTVKVGSLNASAEPVQHLRSKADTLIFLIFSVLLAFFVVFGNTIVMAAFKKRRNLRRRSNMFLISLACSDCLVGIVSLPLWICISGLGIGKGEVLYAFFISFDIFSALTTVFHLIAISVERYISVSRPFLYQRLPAHFYTGTIASAWIAAAAVAASSPLQGLFKLQRFFAPSFFTVGFLGPLVIISVMYAGIFRIALSLSRQTPGITSTACKITCKEKSQLRKEIKLAMTLTLVSGFFFLAWLPFYALLMTAVYCWQCLPGYPGLQRLVDFVKWMHYSNSAVNPFVYALRDPEVKQEFAQFSHVRSLSERFSQSRSRSDQSSNKIQHVWI